MNRLSSIFGAIAVIAIAVVFIVSFQPGRGQNQVTAGPDCAADVLGACVRGTHFWASYRLISPRGASDAFVKQVRLKESTMEGLIERELLVNDAKRLGVGVSEDEVSRELVNGRIHVSLPVLRMRSMSNALNMREDGVREVSFTDKKSNQFSPDAYRKTVTEITHLSETDFRDHQRAELIASRMRDLVRARVHISESEAKDGFVRHKTTSTVKYVKFEKKWVVNHLLDKSDKAVAAWAENEKNKQEIDKLFESRKASYAGECRVAKNIFIKLDPASPTADDDKKKAQEKLEETKKKIEGGTAFEDLAKLLTEDGTNDQGGELGCVLKGQKPKPFEDALYAMKEGDVSAVVETQLGLHLIKLVKIAKGDEALKIGRENTIKGAYGGFEAERIASEAAKEVLAAAQGGKSLEDALKDYLAKAVPKSEPAEGGKKDEKPAGNVKPPKGSNRDAKKTDVKGDPKADPKKDPKADPKKDEEPKDDEDLSKKDDDAPTVETSVPFNVTGEAFEGAAPDVDVAALAFGLKKPGEVASDLIPLDRGEGYAVIQLKERTEPIDDKWKEARDFELWRIRSFKQEDALAAYVKRLRIPVQAEIKINQTFVADPADKKKEPAKGDKKGDDEKPADQPPAPTPLEPE